MLPTEIHVVLNNLSHGWEFGHQASLLPLYRKGCLRVMLHVGEQERSLLSSLPTWPPRSKLSWNIPKVEDQSDGFLCLSLAFKNRAPPNTL